MEKTAQKKYTVEQIIVKLRETELLCKQGKAIAEAARQAGITEQTCYRWRKEYGGMNTADAKRIHERAVRALERLGILCYNAAKPNKECEF